MNALNPILVTIGGMLRVRRLQFQQKSSGINGMYFGSTIDVNELQSINVSVPNSSNNI